MQVRKIKLENVRSFLREEILLQDGITLLAGDIGAGKSTILLAIDFALFGIRRGELDGGALLRHGKKQGSVELVFLLDGKEILIKRILKRTMNGITQDFGYLSVDGRGNELTPVELKQRVIDLLRYPKEALTKKSLIYRYTVYTPQEEMKEILMGVKEERLETLRKVFNIDKYKRLVENTKILTAYVKERKKEYLGKIHDLDEKKKRLEEKQARLAQTSATVAMLDAQLKVVRARVEEKKRQAMEVEEKHKIFQALQQRQQILEVTMTHKREKGQEYERRLQAMRAEMDAEPAARPKPLGAMQAEMHAYETIMQNTEQNLKTIVQRIQEVRTKKMQSKHVQDSIVHLDVCPVCKQKVDATHKERIQQSEGAVMVHLHEQLQRLLGEEAQTEEHLEKLRQELAALKEWEKQAAVFAVQQQEWERKRQEEQRLREEHARMVKEIDALEQEQKGVAGEVFVLQKFVEQRLVLMQEEEIMREEERKVELAKAGAEQEVRDGTQEMVFLQQEVAEKERSKQKLEKYMMYQGMLEERFVPCMQDMERQVFLRVHQDLDSIFQEWFQRLIENENMEVRLDEEFTPVIEQNGYDTEYVNLSGGEKTAAALAYRLALNQVINKMVSTLNTQDLIILDEPTDGFSTQQIEKMRELLRELDMKQIILVSHEAQMENFVDQIIRLEKEGHVSRVVA